MAKSLGKLWIPKTLQRFVGMCFRLWNNQQYNFSGKQTSLKTWLSPHAVIVTKMKQPSLELCVEFTRIPLQITIQIRSTSDCEFIRYPVHAVLLYLCWDCGWLTQPVRVESVRWPRTEGRENLPYQLNNLHLHRRKSGSMSPEHHCTAHLYKEPGGKRRGWKSQND